MIRPAQDGDADSITKIYNEVIATTDAIYEEKPLSAAHLLQWIRRRREEGFPVFVATLGEQVVGYASFSQFRPWGGFRKTVELGLHVGEGFRGRKIGSLLLSALITRARDEGYHVMMAGIDSKNAASQRLHEKHGFFECGKLREVGEKSGRWLDLVFYQLIL